MQQIFNIEVENSPIFHTRSYYKDEGGCPIPFSRIDDYQKSMSKFSTRNESGETIKTKEKKKVQFSPFINVVNIESLKKDLYESSNEEFILNENEQKCLLCSIF